VKTLYPWIEQKTCEFHSGSCGNLSGKIVQTTNPEDPGGYEWQDNGGTIGIIDGSFGSSSTPTEVTCGGDPFDFVHYDPRRRKRKTQTCGWVKDNAEKECRNYKMYCPLTCKWPFSIILTFLRTTFSLPLSQNYFYLLVCFPEHEGGLCVMEAGE
jgi:hypothetical protein